MLRPFVPNGLLVYRYFFYSDDCACDVCDRLTLLSPWLGSHGDYSPTVPAPPSLRTLVPSGSLIRCQAVQVYRHLPSLPRAALLTSLLSFRKGQPFHNGQPLTSRIPVEDPTIRFSISSSTVLLKILLDALSFFRRT
jgi:hypothetical protein